MTTSSRPALAFLLVLSAVFPAFAAAAPVEDKDRPLRVGDPVVVSIRDLEAQGKSTIVKADVDPKGQITLPMLSKPVPAKGLTREKLRDAIVQAYNRDNLIANAIVTVKFRDTARKNGPPVPKE